MTSKTFNVALPQSLVTLADERAKKEFRNRSELIREALWIYLKDKEDWRELLRYGKRQGQKIGVKSGEDVDRIVYESRHRKRSPKSNS